jgi:hypothetical protein
VQEAAVPQSETLLLAITVSSGLLSASAQQCCWGNYIKCSCTSKLVLQCGGGILTRKVCPQKLLTNAQGPQWYSVGVWSQHP